MCYFPKCCVFLFPLYHYCSKIGKFTLARLLTAYDAMMSCMAPHSHDKVHFGEVLKLYADLIELDPMHSQYYKEALSMVGLQQVTLLFRIICFRSHCWRWSCHVVFFGIRVGIDTEFWTFTLDYITLFHIQNAKGCFTCALKSKGRNF